jgi:putative endonuclease
MSEHRYYVYIMASRSRTLYIGFTSALEIRAQQHKNDVYDGFSKQYQCHRLVYFERYDDVHRAIGREKQLKRWSRTKKLALIERDNPAWYDLSENWGKPIEPWLEPAGLSTPLRSGRDDSSELV